MLNEYSTVAKLANTHRAIINGISLDMIHFYFNGQVSLAEI